MRKHNFVALLDGGMRGGDGDRLIARSAVGVKASRRVAVRSKMRHRGFWTEWRQMLRPSLPSQIFLTRSSPCWVLLEGAEENRARPRSVSGFDWVLLLDGELSAGGLCSMSNCSFRGGQDIFERRLQSSTRLFIKRAE